MTNSDNSDLVNDEREFLSMTLEISSAGRISFTLSKNNYMKKKHFNHFIIL